MNENQTVTTVIKNRWKSRKAFLLLGLGAILIAATGGMVWYRYTYPNGYSHCCSAGIGLSLWQYATDHDGWFPHGQSSPEASLSLLCRDETNMTAWVRGKNVPRAVADAAMARDGVLSPQSCGWHYIEGLRLGDDPEIAVVWDKPTGLGHNGERHSDLMHEIIHLDGSHAYIYKTDWPQFVLDQKKKLAIVMASRLPDAPPIRWSDEVALGPNKTKR